MDVHVNICTCRVHSESVCFDIIICRA